jgi:hypothetical protein
MHRELCRCVAEATISRMALALKEVAECQVC